MKYKNLGKTQTKVSEICLGTMTFGEQNSEEESVKQMNFAFNKGVNFFDTTIVGSIFGAIIVFSFFFIFLSIFRYNEKLKYENKKAYKFFKYLVVFPAVVLLFLLWFGIKEGVLLDILQSIAKK